jgi:hypothetical protein
LKAFLKKINFSGVFGASFMAKSMSFEQIVWWRMFTNNKNHEYGK